MKKLIVVLSLFIMSMCFVACNSCDKQKNKIDDNKPVAELVVENVYNLDRQYMFTNYGQDYRWYESCILLKNYLDEECDGAVAGISNVFQVINESGNGADVHVVLVAHTPDTVAYEVKQGFWVEDFPLNDEQIKVTYAQAFEKINQVNLPKPHSKNCVLRKPIGPVACNPQYVFGNISAQLWVDAVTGEVRESNPAFPDGFKMPLGEWP